MTDTERITYRVLTTHHHPGVPGVLIEQKVTSVDWYVADDGVLIFIDERLDETTEENPPGALAVAAFAAGQWLSVSEIAQKDLVHTMILPRDIMLRELRGILHQYADNADAAEEVLAWASKKCPVEFR